MWGGGNFGSVTTHHVNDVTRNPGIDALAHTARNVALNNIATGRIESGWNPIQSVPRSDLMAKNIELGNFGDHTVVEGNVGALLDHTASLNDIEAVLVENSFTGDALALTAEELNTLDDIGINLNDYEHTDTAGDALEDWLGENYSAEAVDKRLTESARSNAFSTDAGYESAKLANMDLSQNQLDLIKDIQTKINAANATGLKLDLRTPAEHNAVKASQMGDYIGEIGSGDYTDYQNLASQGLVAPIDDNLVQTDVGERQNFMAGYLTRNDLWGEGKNAQGENRIGINASDYYGGNLPTDSSNPAIAAASELLGNDSRLWSYDTKGKVWDFVGGTPGQNQKVSLKDYNPDFKYGLSLIHI